MCIASWNVWPSGWVFVYKLNCSGFESSCCTLMQQYIPPILQLYSISLILEFEQGDIPASFVASFLNQECPCRTLKLFKVLNKGEERWNNAGKIAVISSDFSWNVWRTCSFIRNNKGLKLVGYKILIYLITGVLDNFLNLSRHF